MIRRLEVDNHEVHLENVGPSAGKIIVSGDYMNSSYYWGAMGGTIEEFIQKINPDYFAGKLCVNDRTFDAKATFKNVRAHFRNEIYELNGWWKHLEFQKDMREKLRDWERHCDSEQEFVNDWDSFIRSLEFWLVKNQFDEQCLKSELEGISEVWNFIEKKESSEYKRYHKLHGSLKKALKKNQGKIFVEVLS